MNEHVVEILIYLMNELREKPHDWGQIDGLSTDLKKQGYTENEINAAFSWLFERLDGGAEEIYLSRRKAHQQSYRMLHDIEKIVITPEAYGYVLQLQRLGLIVFSEVEQIIERAMLLGGSVVDLYDIKSIVASLIFNSDDLDENHLGSSILETDGIIH